MTVLVTGVAGFVGSRIARRLLDDGVAVVGIDALTDYYDVELKKRNLAPLEADGLQFVRADLVHADLPELLRGVEVVFHEAGQPGVRKSWGEHFDEYADANVLATQRLLEACRSANSLRRVVYASSSSVYGDAESYPTHEETLPRPKSPYGVTKLAAEHLCSLYAQNFGLPTVSLRYFTVYGPGQRPDMAFTRFCAAAVRGERIDVYGTGEQVRDFTYVDDVVDANLRAMSVDVTPGRVYNVSGGSNASVNQALAILTDLAGAPLDVHRGEPALGDVARTGGSAERIRHELGWTPRTSLADGLAAHYTWARDILSA